MALYIETSPKNFSLLCLYLLFITVYVLIPRYSTQLVSVIRMSNIQVVLRFQKMLYFSYPCESPWLSTADSGHMFSPTDVTSFPVTSDDIISAGPPYGCSLSPLALNPK